MFGPHDSHDPTAPIVNNALDIVVLIPAAGRVPEGVLALSNFGCPAMIPVGGRPVIHWTLKYLTGLGLRRFVVAVSRRGMFVEDFVECTFGTDCDISFIVPSLDGGVGQTVMELAEHAAGRSALVVLGDTNFQFADPAVLNRDEAAVLTHPVEESYRWCVADSDEQGMITALHDKEPGLPGPVQALIGVYWFPSLAELQAASRAAVDQATSARRRAELADILTNLGKRRPIRALPAGDWLDCGNSDHQASSHRALLQKRTFNDLSIDSVFGTVTKRSGQVEKFLDEINYLRLLPPELAVLFPRIVACSTEWQDPWVTLEYYGYPTLSEVFVFENVDPGIWEQIFLHLRQILVDGFMKNRRPLNPTVLREMYLCKTRKRLHDMSAPEELLALVRHEGNVRLNGEEIPNLPCLWPRIEAEVDRLARNSTGCVIHGDLCLSNILYDLRSRVCKLLDPRGSFGGSPTLYGDPRYDVAKLYHSVYGLYDFIVSDLFQVRLQGTKIELDIRSRPQHRDILERFEKVFFSAFDRREILLITALLFASMPALHYEAPHRQLAMYARALQLLAEYFSLADAPLAKE